MKNTKKCRDNQRQWILFPLNSVSREHSRRKTNVYLKSPHLKLASKDFKEAK